MTTEKEKIIEEEIKKVNKELGELIKHKLWNNYWNNYCKINKRK